MNSGSQAEKAVADYLSKNGYKILELNWRTKIAEVDIIASKSNTTYFVEVKYRSSPDFGAGYEYVGNQKLKRMRRGAELWVQSKSWHGDYELLVASVSGPDFEHIELIEIFD